MLLSAVVCWAQPVEVDLRFDRVSRVEWVTGESVEISWTQISDSRCATGATCVWEGQVRIWLAVAANGAQADEVEIVLHAGDEDLARATVGGVHLQLVEVDPYPVLDVPVERAAYRAGLLVSISGVTAVRESSWGRLKTAPQHPPIRECHPQDGLPHPPSDGSDEMR